MTAVDDTVPVPACPAGPERTGQARPVEIVAVPGRTAGSGPAAAAVRYRGTRRRGRPLLGPLLMIAGAAELLVTLRLARPGWPGGSAAPAGPLQLLIVAGLAACGLATWLFPVHRSAFSTAAILLGVAALTTADLGGFVAGTLLGAAGGALGFAWVPTGRGQRAAQSGPAAQHVGRPLLSAG